MVIQRNDCSWMVYMLHRIKPNDKWYYHISHVWFTSFVTRSIHISIDWFYDRVKNTKYNRRNLLKRKKYYHLCSTIRMPSVTSHTQTIKLKKKDGCLKNQYNSWSILQLLSLSLSFVSAIKISVPFGFISCETERKW